MNQNVVIHAASRQEIVAFEFEELVATHRTDMKSLGDYANALNISTVYLSECIKKTTGRTAKQIMVDYQIIKAQAMLNTSDTPIYNIAHELGFDEVTNFTKFFKKYTGQTPSQFRKSPVSND
jgi:YesN/AraC family two-component response regulator